MKKSYKNFISISILLFVMCVLIVTVTTLQKPNSLTAGTEINNNNSSTTNQPKETFDYISAKTSYNQNIAFENNFGGSNTDEVYEVFNLGNYYLIGTTTSQNCYFNKNTSNALFVLICDTLGNAKNVYTLSFTKTITFISAKIYENSIYTIIESDGCKLVEFNLSTNLLSVAFSSSNTNCSFISSSEPIVIEHNLNSTTFNFVLSKTQVTYLNSIKNVLLGTDYINGTLLFFNTSNSFKIATLTQNRLTILKEFENYNLQTFNITDKNFILVFSGSSGYKILILSLTFETEQEININNGSNFTLLFKNNIHYLYYLSSNTLNLISFCNHGDTFLNTQIASNVSSYKALLLNNNFYVMLENTDNTLSVFKLNLLTENINNVNILFNTTFNVCYFNISYNYNFITIGNFNGANTTITNNFGNTDVFVMELEAI